MLIAEGQMQAGFAAAFAGFISPESTNHYGEWLKMPIPRAIAAMSAMSGGTPSSKLF